RRATVDRADRRSTVHYDLPRAAYRRTTGSSRPMPMLFRALGVSARRLIRTFADIFGMSLFIKSCPACGYRFRWIERVRSSRCLGFARRVVNCSRCGASVIWSKREWRMMIAGSMVAVGLLPLGIIMGWDHSLDPAAIGWAALVLVA